MIRKVLKMNLNNFMMDIFTSLIGTFSGAFLAFLFALKLKKIEKSNRYKSDLEFLMLRIKENKKILDKIYNYINRSGTDEYSQIYDDVFGRYNNKYILYPVYQIFCDIQTQLFKNYKDKNNIEDDERKTNLYLVLRDLVRLQSIVVRMQEEPIISTDEDINEVIKKKKYIVLQFQNFFNKHSDKYNQISNYHF